MRPIQARHPGGPAATRGTDRAGGAAPASTRAVLLRQLLVAFVLLTAAVAVNPRRPGGAAPPAAPAWDYQHEVVAIQGGGVLNAEARAAITATAWLARAAIERLRDVERLNLLGYAAAAPAARALGAWRAGHALALQGGTAALALALIAYGVLLRPRHRAWLLALALLASGTLVLTRPQSAVRLASAPGVELPAAVGRAAGWLTPAPLAGRGGAQTVEVLAGRWWSGFVAAPLSRLQTGGTVLAGTPAARKPDLLALLRRRVGAVDDWALGRHGPERAAMATLALLYVLPFSLALATLSMVAACAQALSLLLLLAAPAAAPLALEPRHRAALARWWLLPLGGSLALLAFASLGSLVVLWAAGALHALDEEVGVVFAGALVPAALVALAARGLRHHGGGGRC
jgi:hypothetical protein